MSRRAAVVLCYGKGVGEGHGLHHALDVMVAVGALVSYVEPQVYFRRCLKGYRHHSGLISFLSLSYIQKAEQRVLLYLNRLDGA